MRGVGEVAVLVKLRYVHRDVDRYGVVRYYFRRAKGKRKHRITAEPGSQKFLEQYRTLLAEAGGCAGAGAGALVPIGVKTIAPATFRWLYVEYQKSPAFKALAPSTQRRRRNLIETMLMEPIKPDTAKTYEMMPLKSITSKALKVLRDRKAGLPEALNQRVRALRHMFTWAHESENLNTNPARDIKKLKHKSPGHHTWTAAEVEQFERRHPVGTKARLALALLLFTGARRSDVCQLGRQHVRDGWIKFRTRKGGNWFRQQCVAAGVPGRAHGLRKAGATQAAENGATAHQLMAIFGWLTLAQAEGYTKTAQRKKMAGDAMGLLVRTGTKDPH
jgi:integrase